ncbi:MAG: type II toxin-antitoxin system HicB family antitoxin [Rhizomicrobium sp.]
MADYVIALIHEEDGAYGISFPDFPGCVSGGNSLDEVKWSPLLIVFGTTAGTVALAILT